MRPINYDYIRLLSLLCLCIFMALSLQSCDEESCTQAPISIPGITDGGYDPVFSADGGFIITYGMLDKRYNEITFPGTHNSYAYGPMFDDACRNQDISIWEQLQKGIRYIEFDIDGLLEVRHGACTGDFNNRLKEIKNYAHDHPGQIITARISDVVGSLGVNDSYHRVNGRLEDTGLATYVYNWDPTKPKKDPGRCYIPDPWPTLREMIESGKNVMFLHNRKYREHSIVDEGLVRSLCYSDVETYIYFDVYELECMCKLARVWDPPRERQQDTPYGLFLAECEPDQHAVAGHDMYASRNNDGRKLYQLAKHQEIELLPYDRAVNFIIIDYFAATAAGPFPLSINIVDACNRLNYERFGIDWESCEGFWELYPYEFDDSKVEHITQIQELTDEVNKAIDDFNNKLDLGGNDFTGRIVSTPCLRAYEDWLHIPEWAVDGDFFTRFYLIPIWLPPPYGYYGTWGIDLGEPKAIDEIAIAWEFPHHRPGYIVYASNDDGRFADGISQDELTSDEGWVTVVEEQSRVVGGQEKLWDQVEFEVAGCGTCKWRYIKVQVTAIGEWETPSFFELRLYGPAN